MSLLSAKCFSNSFGWISILNQSYESITEKLFKGSADFLSLVQSLPFLTAPTWCVQAAWTSAARTQSLSLWTRERMRSVDNSTTATRDTFTATTMFNYWLLLRTFQPSDNTVLSVESSGVVCLKCLSPMRGSGELCWRNISPGFDSHRINKRQSWQFNNHEKI